MPNRLTSVEKVSIELKTDLQKGDCRSVCCILLMMLYSRSITDAIDNEIII